jgi:muramidase (phage lysozyme)
MAEYKPEDIEKMEKFFDLVGQINGVMSEEEKEKQELIKRSKELRDKWEKFGRLLGNTATELGKAAVSPKEGFSKFNSSITSAGEVASDLAGNFGILGKAAGLVIKAFTSLATAALEQNDQLVNSFQTLSDLGSVTKGGIAALGEQIRATGLTVAQAQKFEKILQNSSGTLAGFRGSVMEGRQSLIDVITQFTNVGNKFEFQLNNLGISTDSIREGVADYIGMQTRLGLAQRKDTNALRDESFKYMVTLKQLQELTGLSRDEQQKIRDQQLQDARLAMHINELAMSGRQQEALQLQNYMTVYQKTFGTEAAAGLKDLILNQGAITSQAAAAVAQSQQTAYQDAITAQKQGMSFYMTGLKNSATSIQERTKQLRGTFNLQENILKDMGLSNEAVIGSLGIMDTRGEKFAETIKLMEQLQKNNGKGIQQNTEANQRSRATALAFDAALQQVGTTFVDIMGWVQKALFKFGKFLAYVIEKFGPSLGIDVKAGDLLQFFRDADDVTKDLTIAREAETLAVERLKRAEQDVQDIRTQGIANAFKTQSALVKKLDSEFAAMQEGGNVPTNAEIERMAAAQQKLNLLEKLKNANLEEQTNLFNSYLGKSKESLKLEQEKIKNLQEELRIKRLNESMSQSGKVDSEVSATSQIYDKTFGKLLDFIGKAEGAGYSTVFGGKTNASLTEMSLKDVLNYQSKLFAENKVSSAVGKYQFIKPTLETLMKNLKLTGEEKFSSELQDTLAKELIKYRMARATDKKSGKMSLESFMDELAKEWASLPLTTGRSYYHGDKAGNRARVSREELRMNLSDTIKLPEGKTGGFFAGSPSGYPVLLHGNESVWPEQELRKLLNDVQKTSLEQYKEQMMTDMKNQPTIPKVESAIRDDSVIISAFNTFSKKLDEVVNYLDKGNSIQSELLNYTKL